MQSVAVCQKPRPYPFWKHCGFNRTRVKHYLQAVHLLKAPHRVTSQTTTLRQQFNQLLTKCQLAVRCTWFNHQLISQHRSSFPISWCHFSPHSNIQIIYLQDIEGKRNTYSRLWKKAKRERGSCCAMCMSSRPPTFSTISTAPRYTDS